jgi:hypothetical protein
MKKFIKLISFVGVILAPVFVYANNKEEILSGVSKEFTRYGSIDAAYFYLFAVVLFVAFFGGYIISKLSHR